jgi:hypothetical protein
MAFSVSIIQSVLIGLLLGKPLNQKAHFQKNFVVVAQAL